VPVVNGYCSVADIKEHVGDTEFGTIPDTLIERAINATSRAIDNYCGFPRRRFWQDITPTTHEYVTDVWDSLYIDDLSSTTGLVIATDVAGDSLFSTVWTPSDYRLYPLNANVNGSAFAWTQIRPVGSVRFPLSRYGRTTVRITGLHGWSAVPPEVTQACVIRTTSILKRKDAVFGVAGFGEFGTSVRIRAEDPDVADLLATFRRYGAGTTG